MLRGKRPNNTEFADDIVRIHYLIIHTDMLEYEEVSDTKAHSCIFFFFSKLKAGENITTGQYMNYQTFSNLQIRPLLKSSFNGIHIDLRDTSAEDTPFVSVGITRLVLMFKKASNIHFQPKRCEKLLASRQVEILVYKRIGQVRRRWFAIPLGEIFGRTATPVCVNILSQLQSL